MTSLGDQASTNKTYICNTINPIQFPYRVKNQHIVGLSIYRKGSF